MKKALTLQHSLESVLLRKSKEGEQLLLNATCCLCTALVLDDIMWYLRLIEAVSGSWYFDFIHFNVFTSVQLETNQVEVATSAVYLHIVEKAQGDKGSSSTGQNGTVSDDSAGQNGTVGDDSAGQNGTVGDDSAGQNGTVGDDSYPSR
ncbi:hypothetical protein FVA96_24465, partial [Escherichia coli]|nr:hypothetical protein [Escherichia coli]